MDKMDEGLKTLLDLGKRRGFLTFDQVNDFLPDEASSPEKISGLLPRHYISIQVKVTDNDARRITIEKI